MSGKAIQRIEDLLDENSFVELASLVTSRTTDFNMLDKKMPSDGVIIGHGLIHDQLVFVFSQDALVLDGSIGEMHAKKILSIYDMAMKMGAPVIGLLDCSGVRLQESVDALESMGMIYKKSVEASGVIPQIMAVFGNAGGGLSVLASLADFTFMAEDAQMFIHSPDAIEKNTVVKNNTSSAEFQLKYSGNVDSVGSEAQIMEKIQQLVLLLPESMDENGRVDECLDDLNRACSSMDEKRNCILDFVTEISDNETVFVSKEEFATEMFTGLIKLSGMTIGVIGNQKKEICELTVDGCNKAVDFIQFCDAFGIPMLSLTNTQGYEASVYAESHLAKALAKMAGAFSSATVPQINLILSQAVGTSYLFMNSKSLGADLVYSYPDAMMEIMKPELAASILADNPQDVAKIAAEFEEKTSGVMNAARHGWIDRMVDFADTRKYLISGFEMLYSKSVEETYKKHLAK